MLKITSGKYRGIPLFAPEGETTRPTLSKTRQAFFNMTREYLDGSVFVDMFAGTGAFGFEALSNGAKKAYFADDKTAALIRKNAGKIKAAAGDYEILGMDYAVAWKKLVKSGVKADIVFADPPYNLDFARKILKLQASGDILNDNGILALELHAGEEPTVIEGFESWKRKQYGDTVVLILKKKDRGGPNG